MVFCQSVSPSVRRADARSPILTGRRVQSALRGDGWTAAMLDRGTDRGAEAAVNLGLGHRPLTRADVILIRHSSVRLPRLRDVDEPGDRRGLSRTPSS